MKIVINRCYGGFGISDACSEALGGTLIKGCSYLHCYEFPDNKRDSDFRTDPALIELMETKGSEWCSGYCAELKVVEIPDDVDYTIEEYDGMEWISESHRTWC